MIKELLYKIETDKLLIALLFVAFVFAPFLLSVDIILYFILLVYQNKLQRQYTLGYVSIFMILFYLTTAISLLWTENIKAGFFDLEVKLSLLFFPIFIGFSKYLKKDIEKIIAYSSMAFFVTSMILICRVILYYFYQNEILSYNDYTVHLHPTYFSMYAVLFISYYLFHKKNHTFYFFIYLIVMSISIFLAASKAGIIALFFLFSFYLLKHYRLYSLIFIVLIITFGYFIFYKTNYFNFISYRIRTTQETVEKYIKNEPLPIESNSIRIYAWKASVNIIRQKWLIGVGCGDTHDVLNEYYRTHGLQSLSDKNINAHNTFFQILLSSGLVALLCFMAVLFYTGFLSVKRKMTFIATFVIILVLIYLPTESMLETQGGTIFFGLSFSLFDKYLKL